MQRLYADALKLPPFGQWAWMEECYLLPIFFWKHFFLELLDRLRGVGVGYILALGAVGMLSETVNALYFATSVEALSITVTDLIIGVGLGVTFSLLAGLIPARDATQTPPAQILARGDWSPGFHWLRNPRMGLLLLFFGALTLLFPSMELEGGSKLPVGGFVTAGCWILGAALLSGHLLVLFTRMVPSLLFRTCLPIGM